MIAIIDPAVLRAGPADEVEERLARVYEVLSETSAELPDHGDPFWLELHERSISPLKAGARRSLREAATALEWWPARSSPPEVKIKKVLTWGFKSTFAWAEGQGFPINVVEDLMLRAVADGRETLVITDDIEGHDCSFVSHSQSAAIVVRTRWQITLTLDERAPAVVPTVRNVRNITVPWTQRYDEDLPAASDGGPYPFCPPRRWWMRSVDRNSVVNSKPGFRDFWQNGWTRPSQGGTLHWDLHLNHKAHVTAIGIGQLNVRSLSGGEPGTLDHVPEGKKSRLKPHSGWSCPDCSGAEDDTSGEPDERTHTQRQRRRGS